MKHFQFHVPGWMNVQIIWANTEKECWDKAQQIAGEEKNIRGWKDISHLYP
jgi:hypothetical protein